MKRWFVIWDMTSSVYPTTNNPVRKPSVYPHQILIALRAHRMFKRRPTSTISNSDSGKDGSRQFTLPSTSVKSSSFHHARRR